MSDAQTLSQSQIDAGTVPLLIVMGDHSEPTSKEKQIIKAPQDRKGDVPWERIYRRINDAPNKVRTAKWTSCTPLDNP